MFDCGIHMVHEQKFPDFDFLRSVDWQKTKLNKIANKLKVQ